MPMEVITAPRKVRMVLVLFLSLDKIERVCVDCLIVCLIEWFAWCLTGLIVDRDERVMGRESSCGSFAMDQQLLQLTQ